MERLEKVEKIVEKTGVTFEEAMHALDAANGDVLDAIIYLEHAGKTRENHTASYSTGGDDQKEYSEEFTVAQVEYQKESKKSFGNMLDELVNFCKKLFKKSLENNFNVIRNGKVVLDVPVLVFVIALLFFEITLPLMIIGLFFGFRYHFVGVGNVNMDINKFCDKAGDAAEDIRHNMRFADDNK